MIVHNDLVQGSEEWLKIRLGKLTGSDFHVLMGSSATKENILYKKAAERLTGVASDGDRFSSIHTERGHQLENDARTAYELETGNVVTQVGFVELDEFVGCSPDGLIGNIGIEIKCKDNHGFLKAVTKNYIEPEHKTQMQFNMYVCNLEWMDYLLYNPNFSNPLFTIQYERDDEYIETIKTHIIECNKKINGYVAEFNKL
jgi:predicted phage-related endonuclease